jgi:uncharacterized protein (DUF2267 family)
MTSPIILRAAVASLPESAVRTLVDALIARDASEVAAELEPVLAASGAPDPSKPAVVVDSDDDTWTLRPNGSYAMAGDVDSDAYRDLASIRAAYGPIKTPDGVVIPE